MNTHISMFNEMCSTESPMDVEALGQQLAEEARERQKDKEEMREVMAEQSEGKNICDCYHLCQRVRRSEPAGLASQEN